MVKKIGLGFMGAVIAVLVVVGIVQQRQLQTLRKADAPEEATPEIVPEPAIPVSIVQETAAPSENPAPEPEPEETAPSVKITNEQMDAMGKMMNNPAMKEVMRASLKGSLEVTYGALADYLDLTTEDRELFMEMLADQQMALMEVGWGSMDSSVSKDDRVAAAQKKKDLAALYETEIHAFLGEEKSDIYDQYQNTQPERMLVNMYSRSVEGEYQLSEDQEHDLILAMHEERENFPFTTGLSDEDLSDLSDESVSVHVAELARLEEKYIERSKTVLDASQIEAFSASLKQSRIMQEASLRMAAQLFSGPAE